MLSDRKISPSPSVEGDARARLEEATALVFREGRFLISEFFNEELFKAELNTSFSIS
ncbi:MAG TPA: hypothetical protein VMW24_06065 [Sedimentisphaerales bacterium]|nr:hypothetical protein [Sedimentisphaerales bacterium]